MVDFSFTPLHKDTKTKARVGEIVTPHGVIQTPAFVPVGTQATVKSLTPEELSQLGVNLFFVNTYHAHLRPGTDIIQKFGGLHRFMHWDKPLITDSGGFQVFSLGKKKYINIALSESAVLDREKFTKKLPKADAVKEHVYPDDYRPIGELVRIDEDGVTFTSHWDGSQHRFTPEVSIDIQHALGADIIIAFDECTPYPATYEYSVAAMERTHRWAKRRLAKHREQRTQNAELKSQNEKQNFFPLSSEFSVLSSPLYQALYGVVQGSVFSDLREKSARVIGAMGFDGIAIGGVSVGESKKEMEQVLEWTVPYLPDDKPRHLLGVGEIDDIFVAVENGMDTFDCVQPTRLARMGVLFNIQYPISNTQWHIDITKKEFAEDMGSIFEGCSCYTCQNFSRAYLHHLFRVRELLGYRLATIHNIYFVNQLVGSIRLSIIDGSFLELKKKWLYNRR